MWYSKCVLISTTWNICKPSGIPRSNSYFPIRYDENVVNFAKHSLISWVFDYLSLVVCFQTFANKELQLGVAQVLICILGKYFLLNWKNIEHFIQHQWIFTVNWWSFYHSFTLYQFKLYYSTHDCIM